MPKAKKKQPKVREESVLADFVPNSVLFKIVECLKAAYATRALAAACRAHFEAAGRRRSAGRALLEILSRFDLDRRESRAIRDWPESQLRLLGTAIVEAARLREDGYPIDVRVSGVVGYPPAIGVSLASPSHLTITFVSTKFV